MDINLPLFLFLAVAGTGVVWLYDFIILKRQRMLEIDAVEARYGVLSDEQKKTHESYRRERSAAEEEPLIVEYSKSFFPVLLLVFVLRSFLVEPFQIPSESMVPTLEVGDFILVNKFAYGIRLPLVRTKIIDVSDPERGDVMVFFPPDEDRYFIKRVIGLPGDTITVKDGFVFVNGERAQQEYLYTDSRTHFQCARVGGSFAIAAEALGDDPHLMRRCTGGLALSEEGTWVVREGHYFMMGDNRDNSSDSRKFGLVPEDRIVGKAFAIWMHWESLLSLPSFSRVGAI